MSKSLIAIAGLALALPAAAHAQDAVETGDDSYNMVIVYGDRALLSVLLVDLVPVSVVCAA